MTDYMNVQSPMYAFGNHFLDTFVDLKAGDYANRVMGIEPPILCAPAYDEATGDLFFRIARTFPADIVTHAYGSVLTILRAGLPAGPLERVVGGIPGAFLLARPLDRLLTVVAPIVPLAAVGAVAVAWNLAPRLGIALTVFLLFLTGYPAIEFESRHWFHLRFLSLWMVVVLWAAWRHGRGKWTAAALRRGLVPVAATIGLMALALWTLRILQRPALDQLVDSYLAAPVEPLRGFALSKPAWLLIGSRPRLVTSHRGVRPTCWPSRSRRRDAGRTARWTSCSVIRRRSSVTT